MRSDTPAPSDTTENHVREGYGRGTGWVEMFRLTGLKPSLLFAHFHRNRKCQPEWKIAFHIMDQTIFFLPLRPTPGLRPFFSQKFFVFQTVTGQSERSYQLLMSHVFFFHFFSFSGVIFSFSLPVSSGNLGRQSFVWIKPLSHSIFFSFRDFFREIFVQEGCFAETPSK